MFRLGFFLAVVVAAGPILPALAQTMTPDPASAAAISRNTAPSYPLDAGDTLKITVFGVKDLSGEYSVDAKGDIVLPLIGQVRALGLNSDAVADNIRSKLADGYLKDPRVTVEVASYRPFYILGEVNKPGQFPFVANMTIEQAVASAGGYTYRAARKKAFLRRGNVSEQVIKFGDKPVYVMPGDTIRIGERYL